MLESSSILAPRLGNAVVVNLNGSLCSDETDKEQARRVYRTIGENNHKYYKFEMNKLFGLAGLASLYNSVSSGALWFYERGPASFTNFNLEFFTGLLGFSPYNKFPASVRSSSV